MLARRDGDVEVALQKRCATVPAALRSLVRTTCRRGPPSRPDVLHQRLSTEEKTTNQPADQAPEMRVLPAVEGA
jgi:hypothetical protein